MSARNQHVFSGSTLLDARACFEQRPRQPPGPLSAPGLVGEKVLAKFDADMQQTALFTIHGNRVVGAVAGGIWFVVTNNQIRIRAQGPQHLPRQAAIPVVQHAGVPGTLLRMEYGSETVHRHENAAPLRGLAPIQFGAEALVVGPEYFLFPCQHLGRKHRLVARNARALAHANDGLRTARRAVAVDDKPGIGLQYQEGIEGCGQLRGNLRRAYIKGDVPLQISGCQAQRIEPARHPSAGVIADQEEWRLPILPLHAERARLIGREQ
jgi:hypothetical protein